MLLAGLRDGLTVSYVFSPLARLTTGALVGVEVLPRIRDRAAERAVAEAARGPGRAALDAGVAAGAVRWSAATDLRIPLHVNLLADTVAEDGGALGDLHAALDEVGWTPDEVLLEIGPPIGDPDPEAITAGASRLRELGYRLAVDEVGLHDHPLAMIAQLEPELVKLHPEIAAGLPDDPDCDAVVDAVRRLCQHIGAELAADGITDLDQLRALRRHGIRTGQGPLLADPTRRPPTAGLAIPAPVDLPAGTVPHPRAPAGGSTSTDRPGAGGPDSTIGSFSQPALVLADTVTGDTVRDAFRDAPGVSSVVLVDPAHRPIALVDRNRFMLAVSGQFGHALHARRPVRDLADPPRILPATADPAAALELIGVGARDRLYDDITVVDRDGRCTGVARIGDLLRGIAELNYDRALALHPATGLPGLPALTDLLDDRLARGEGFALGLFACDLAALVDRGGFVAATDGLRAVAAAVAVALAERPGSTAVHATGDDLVVLADLDQAAEIEQTVLRQLTQNRHGPPVQAAWLRCPPGQPVESGDLAREVARLAVRAHRAGSGAGPAPR